MFFGSRKLTMPQPEEALPGRDTPLALRGRDALHAVKGTPIQPPFPEGLEQLILGMGCFWGAEQTIWQLPGVYTTAVGYTGGYTPHPGYEEVCSGYTGHNEVVLAVYDPVRLSLEQLLRVFWESHDPTQGMRQGNDRGTQYRSGLYTFDDRQGSVAESSRERYQSALDEAGRGAITTEIAPAGPFYYAEAYHQQYLAKNPGGYCGLQGLEVPFPQ